MIDQFPGHFRKSQDQIVEIWKNCTFAIDANVLLNLYRYSPATSKSSIDVLKRLKDRIWLPWQVACEFHENRLGVIDKQTRAYGSTVEAAKKVLKLLENPREHPFVEAQSLQKFSDCIGEICQEMELKQNARRQLLIDDPLLQEISKLFHDRVGKQPDENVRAAMLKRASERCEKKIPPGFRDVSKEGTRPFGDALMWFELMEFAKVKSKPIVFVTDDTKNDWWLEVSGVTVGPLPALVQEFVGYTGQQFMLYRPDRFFGYASTFLKQHIDASAVEEMREQTAGRLRRSKRQRRYFSEDAQHLSGLCMHLWSHHDEARQLLSAINTLSQSEWRSLKGPFDLPSEVKSKIDTALSECRCLRHLLPDIHGVSAPGYHDAVAEMENQTPQHALELLARCRQIPNEAVEVVRLSQPKD